MSHKLYNPNFPLEKKTGEIKNFSFVEGNLVKVDGMGCEENDSFNQVLHWIRNQ